MAIFLKNRAIHSSSKLSEDFPWNQPSTGGAASRRLGHRSWRDGRHGTSRAGRVDTGWEEWKKWRSSLEEMGVYYTLLSLLLKNWIYFLRIWFLMSFSHKHEILKSFYHLDCEVKPAGKRVSLGLVGQLEIQELDWLMIIWGYTLLFDWFFFADKLNLIIKLYLQNSSCPNHPVLGWWNSVHSLAGLPGPIRFDWSVHSLLISIWINTYNCPILDKLIDI